MMHGPQAELSLEEAAMTHRLRERRSVLLYLVGILMIATLTIVGCGVDSYKDPAASITTTKTETSLIEAATLKQWMDEGKVNSTDPANRDKVVIVTVASAAQYAAQHIPGALLMDSGSEATMTRMDGLAPISTEVLDGPSVDALVSKLGIDEHTTVVFSASKNQNALNPARAYFTFRYWGFPKERLKILNGGENGWDTAVTNNGWLASYATTSISTPAPAASSFSVKKLYNGGTANFDLRTSLGQMITVVDKINAGTLPIDATGVAILDTRGGAITGNITNALIDDYAQYALSGTGNTSTYKPTSDIVSRLTGSFNITASTSLTFVYCASGVRAASVFFVLDGILGWPVTMYDGSWNQWNAYVPQIAPAVSPNSAWLVTNVSPGTIISRTTGTATGTITVDTSANTMYTTITDYRANQILNEDKAYFTSGGTSGTTTGGGGGPSPGC
jgi:3-mercaptopyruvate sulfurtransferase SseA